MKMVCPTSYIKLREKMKIVITDEPEYIMETREILEGLFLLKHGNNELINNEDLVKLLMAKKKSVEMRDRSFEGILLDTGRICDEKMKEEKDTTAFENFGYIVTFFDRYDATSAIINQLSFMERININEDQVRSLLGNKKIFDELKEGLFKGLFFNPILENRYLAYYGRKKMEALLEGLEEIEKGNSTLQRVVAKIYSYGHEEELYHTAHQNIKDRIKTFYSELNTKEEQEVLRREVNKDLLNKNEIEKDIPDHVFSNVIMNIKKEENLLCADQGFALAGRLAGLGALFYLGLALAALHLAWQVRTVDLDDPADCLAKFKSNRDFGFVMMAAIVAGSLTA